MLLLLVFRRQCQAAGSPPVEQEGCVTGWTADGAASCSLRPEWCLYVGRILAQMWSEKKGCGPVEG